MARHIREIERTEVGDLVGLCVQHADYENAVLDFQDLDKRLLALLFNNSPELRCLVALVDDVMVGYATFSQQISTWTGGTYIYLDCLYLNEDFRGLGLGGSLLEGVKEYAMTLDCHQLQWQTPTSNESAIGFYKSIGATHLDKKRFFWEVN